MTGRKYDIAIVGGGLSGGLIALALKQRRPGLALCLLESGETIGGAHRWSWFDTDLPEGGERLLAPFRKTAWDNGYDVRFPNHARHLPTPYRSLSSDDFAAALDRELPEGAVRLKASASALDARGVTLADGERIEAGAVIDCRGFAPTPHLTGGWQLFLGHHLRMSAPHGVERPVIMDADVAQHGAYRFVYVLPLGANDLFVEDTYYTDSPLLDRGALSGRIGRYCARHGWEGRIIASESGVLPVITGGDFSAFQAALRIEGVARAGARGGFMHPLTSYTLPHAVAAALAVAENAALPGPQLAALLEARARDHWRGTGFYRKLGQMLFGAARPEERWRILERFHRLPDDLIERFYAARSTCADRFRILCGKPPVPLGRAAASLLRAGAPLAQRAVA
ncbi:lycopene beta-cyclase CrtY [Tsuneonella sp. CC-YZS046]|uniref:lycopene beta-cyclase CrtY n=1 Tax=Tsuneonella sp. CC-YZS046 TaxID=3042152 RepID=UPI002D781A63|nr:lycopene beta-cyclase CrtY [Tsuneonella sp. CC-YZS046]WRO67129.1 lycopene beta-cyclase CrtY [Tsuneonella sp. CC-YZS046]